MGVKKLVLSGDLCNSLEYSSYFNDFMLNSLQVFPALKIVKFNELYCPAIFDSFKKCMNL